MNWVGRCVLCEGQNVEDTNGANRLSLLGLMRVNEYGVIFDVGRWKVGLT
jgi:hypothetical protein